MDKDNQYTKMQREQYDSSADIMAVDNHRGHDYNPDYYGLLLKELSDNPSIWSNKTALDFGCGCGRNVDNLLGLNSWNQVHGCDISRENIIRAEKYLSKHREMNDFDLFTTSGVDLKPIPDNQYDFVMSTIVLQHIPVYDIRFLLLSDIYRVMKDNGLFSFQMAKYNSPHYNAAKYFDNLWTAKGTNGYCDVSVDNPEDLKKDLLKIGFKNISFELKPEWDANNKRYLDEKTSQWLFMKAYR